MLWIQIAVALTITGTSVWVLFDIHRLGMSRDHGPEPSSGLLYSPTMWFLGCLLLPIVMFPLYLIARALAMNERRNNGALSGAPPDTPSGTIPQPALAAAPGLAVASAARAASAWLGLLSLVLGIASILSGDLVTSTCPLSLCGLVLGIMGARSRGPQRTLAIVGIITSVIGFVIMVATIISIVMFFNNLSRW